MGGSTFSAAERRVRQMAAYKVSACPSCGAVVGQRCKTRAGRYMTKHAGHKPRRKAAAELAALGVSGTCARPHLDPDGDA